MSTCLWFVIFKIGWLSRLLVICNDGFAIIRGVCRGGGGVPRWYCHFVGR